MSKYGPEFPSTDYFDAPGGSSAQFELAPGSVFFHELSLNTDNIRNPENKRFITSHNFIPYYRSEITVSNKNLGLTDALFEARYAGNNVSRPLSNQIRAAEEAYAKAEDYLEKSRADLSKLRLAFPESETLPSPQEIKSNSQILEVIAKFILAFRKFEAEDWPAWNAGILASALEQIKEGLVLISDDEAVVLWDMARINLNERYKFWSAQIAEVKDNRIVREVKSLRDLRSRTQPESGADQSQGVEYEGMIEQRIEPTPMPEEEQPAEILSAVPAMIEGTQVEVITDQPVAQLPRRQPKPEPQKETLFKISDNSAKKKVNSPSRPVRGKLAMFADAGRIPQHELDRKAGRESEAPDTNPDADLDELFGPGEPSQYLKF